MKEGWTYKRFDEIMTPAKVERCGNREDLPILSITMHGGIVEQNDRFKKTIASVDKTNYKVVKDGQLVIAFPIDEGLLYTQDVANEGIMSPAYNIWDVDYSQIDRRFLVAYFHSRFAFSYYKAKLRGSTQRRRSMDKADLLSMPIPVPSLVVQKGIVSELDLLSDVIEKKKAQIEEFDKLAQSTFYDMFGDPVTNEKGWILKQLKDLGDLGRGVSKHRPRNAPELLGGSMPLIQTGDVANAGMYITNYTTTYSEKGVSQSKVWKAGTLCITIAANIGNCSILTFDACFPDSVVGFIANNDIVNKEYIFFIFQRMQSILEANAPAVAQKNINLKILDELRIPLPPLALQQEFAAKIEAIEQMKAKVRQSLKETEELFNSRMDYYFN